MQSILKAVVRYVWPSETLAVAFDEKCEMCQSFRRISATMLSRRSGVIMDSAQHPVNASLQAVDREARLDTLHAAEGDSIVHGFAAVSALARRTVVGPVVAPLVAAFEFSTAGDAIYKQVNRHRKCNQGHCPRPAV